MATIIFENNEYNCNGHESVLDCLLRHNIDIAFSCKSGTCQACLMLANSGEIPRGPQTRLTENLIQQNYFLSCLYYPDGIIHVSRPQPSDLFHNAQVRGKQSLSDSIMELTIEADSSFTYKSGQFINIRRDDGLIRSYSLASMAQDSPLLELHIKRMPGGKMSNWLFDEVNTGDELSIQGPNGKNIYAEKNKTQAMLLIATGVGLAPLYGILRTALDEQHQNEIVLFHGQSIKEELYLDQKLHYLAEQNSHFTYYPCINQDDLLPGYLNGRVNERVLKKYNKLDDWQVYIAGAPTMVTETQKAVILAGAKLPNIHIDPFDLQDLRRKRRS